MNDDSQPEAPTRAERRAQRRAERRNEVPWLGAAILIALGAVFLLQNLGIITLTNWWALFILIPAGGSFANAWRIYRATGEWGPAAGPLIGGLIFTALALMFLFNISLGINWGTFWPLLLIAGGIALLLQVLGGNRGS
jgi:hypothetical protein